MDDHFNDEDKLDLTTYDGPGRRIKNKEGVVVEITLTEDQERAHDRQYRQRLIEKGILTPKKSTLNGKGLLH